MEALIISVDEPQLDRCLVSVRNQTVPFSNIIHVNNVVPEYAAFNQGMSKTTDRWTMKIDGDFILYDAAVEDATKYMQATDSDQICGYFFGLYDTFLECPIGFCSVLRTSVYKDNPYLDKLSNDRYASRMIRRNGWKIRKQMSVVTGTHFDHPDEFQVFKRFYTQHLKYPYSAFVKVRMSELLIRTGNPLYDIGIKAGEFAAKKKIYPGSHNLVFDQDLFEEFQRENNT